MKAESVHFVLFGQVDVSDLSSVFKQTFGVPATTLQPLPGDAGSSASAKIGSLVANLIFQPARIEIIAGVEQTQDAVMLSIDFDEAMALVRAKASVLIDQFPSSNRLGIAANVFESHAGPEDALDAFKRYTKIDVPPDCLDTSFVMNRRAKVGAITVNRVLRWDNAVRQIFQFSPQLITPITHSFHVLSRQVDVNNVLATQTLSVADAKALLEGLVREATECISGGYDYIVK